MKILAYIILLGMLIGVVSGSAFWYKGIIDAQWEAQIAEANAKAKETEAAAELQTAKSNAVVEKLHAKLTNAINAVKIAEGCASQSLPASVIAILSDLGLLTIGDGKAVQPQPATRPAAPAN